MGHHVDHILYAFPYLHVYFPETHCLRHIPFFITKVSPLLVEKGTFDYVVGRASLTTPPKTNLKSDIIKKSLFSCGYNTS